MQLKMWWNNTGDIPEVTLPEGFKIRSYEDEKDVFNWVDITKEDLQDSIKTVEDFTRDMLNREGVRKEHIYFICLKDEAVATVTAIMYPEKKQGYVHMVGCKRKYRGRGLGTALINLALKVFNENGMENAYLKTDDFRIPAIKSYLRAGFTPMLYHESMEERWKNVLKECDVKSMDYVDKKGVQVRIISNSIDSRRSRESSISW